VSQLQRLGKLLPGMIESYQGFEEAAGKADPAVYGEQLDRLREFYAADLGALIELLGRAYVADPNPARPEYAFPNQVASAVAVYGRIPPEDMNKRWMDAVHARSQHQLDLKFPEEYEKLAAWTQTLHELRRKFNAGARQLPPSEMNFGRLTEGGRGLLEMYDAFSGKLEDLWPSWRTFAATLPPVGERPERMEKERKAIEAVFKSEHLDCFTQMYKIYALDAELSHPAYEHLRSHFEFADATWPTEALAYRGIYQQYEKQWDDNWKDGVPVNPAGDEDDGGSPDLLGPPGFLPDLPPSS
jgi:hypothetical protein